MAEIKVPTLGESVSEATVAKWLKKEGDSVAADETIVELETDKVTLEVNAPSAGVISRIIAPEGSNVGVGAILGEIGAGVAANDGKGGAKSDPVAPAPAAPAPAVAVQSAPTPVTSNATPAEAEGRNGPAANKMMADNNINAADVSGTGRDGRVTKGDVINHMEGGAVKQSPPPMGAPAGTASAPREAGPREERVKMTRLRQSIAKRLKEAQNTAAMLTTFNEVDMTAVMEMRSQYKDAFEKKYKVKLGFMSFFVKAAVNALKEFPAVNAEISGDEIIYKNYYDLGIAVSTPQGLIVPVVKDCDSKNMAQIEKDIADVGLRARDGKVTMDEMKGGTFTITNGGTFGSMLSTPILNTPQSGILGMHNIVQRPVVMPDGSIKARPVMYLALSYDHRIIDGKEAVSFLVRIKQALEDPQRLILEV
ncbi:MAG: dihydrolipoamide succinyltransferase [Micavibrio aeruginosavorus]|uniref:Dihydrolipoyllysine-residue succinyltransferase component of 2-oxoglutarate dehydrogenase complex n=1 Tax=Micavibrio aeruginosavorus TaxID=349221 RepID=A0A2W5C3M7_9BACT|nr:MAG: dihydrolipoamide succinyltransferase [Micavibrio aeruginosavorus]